MSQPKLSNHAPAATDSQERRYARYRFDSRIQASVFRQGQTITMWGRANELGGDGLGATFSGELQVGEVISIEFSIPLPPNALKMRAAVRYSEGLRCGLEFLVMSEQQRLIVKQICAVLANAT